MKPLKTQQRIARCDWPGCIEPVRVICACRHVFCIGHEQPHRDLNLKVTRHALHNGWGNGSNEKG